MAKDTVAQEIDSLARDLVREKLHDAMERPNDSFSAPENAAVNGVLSRVPPNQGFYFKVYKKYPIPENYGKRPVFLLDIQQPDLIDDLESHLQKLAKSNKWGDGIYEVKKFQAGHEGQLGDPVQVTLHVPPDLVDPNAPKNGAAPASPDPLDSIRTTAGLIKELQNASPSVSPDSITKAVTEAVKTIVDATKAQVSTPQAPLDIVGIVTALKSLVPPPAPTQSPTDLITLIASIQKLVAPPAPPRDNILDIMVKMKEAGLLGGNGGVDPTTKAIELLSNLAPLIQSLSGGGGGGNEPGSFGVELVRALGPQVGKIVGDVTETINKVVTSRGTPSTSPSRQPSVPSAPPPTAIPSVANSESAPGDAPVANVSTQVEDTPMLPIFRPIKEAIEARDVKFFPKAEELLVTYAGPAYDQLLAGTITIDQVIDYVKPLGGGFLDNETSRVYLNDFLAWARSKRETMIKEANAAMPPATPIVEHPPALSAKCPKCGEIFDFDDEEAFAEEPNCEDCVLPLIRVNENGAIEVAEPTTPTVAE